MCALHSIFEPVLFLSQWAGASTLFGYKDLHVNETVIDMQVPFHVVLQSEAENFRRLTFSSMNITLSFPNLIEVFCFDAIFSNSSEVADQRFKRAPNLKDSNRNVICTFNDLVSLLIA